MKYQLVLVVCLLLASTELVSAQRRAPVVSPEVNEAGQVTFRVAAPDAEKVMVSGQWQGEDVEMKKKDRRLWEVTVADIPPGVWEYSIKIDGVSMIDQNNSDLKPMRSPRRSILHLPSNPPAVHDFQEVPHGTVHLHDYASKVAGDVRQFVVYTPPGYEAGSEEYPVLYLFHGSGDIQTTWTTHGKAHWILDNLIASGDAEPMLIVMLNGHAAPPEDRSRNTELFEKDLMQQVMPMVEKVYRVKSDAANRGIVGLSMGGGQSLTIGLKHTDTFAWVGGFSSGTPEEATVQAAFEDVERTNRELKLLWIACGEDDFLLDRNKEFIQLLEQKGIDHEWMETEGAHSWPVWREYLADFLPRLFK
ncbi:Carbohydrate acetyl esterase/feruloyl esterase [Planctomycetales bacterium 10988]|nr:Carbohydrate acetyl esterase/feruloyl esterase [Planctomycetales bacterium 10988]